MIVAADSQADGDIGTGGSAAPRKCVEHGADQQGMVGRGHQQRRHRRLRTPPRPSRLRLAALVRRAEPPGRTQRQLSSGNCSSSAGVVERDQDGADARAGRQGTHAPAPASARRRRSPGTCASPAGSGRRGRCSPRRLPARTSADVRRAGVTPAPSRRSGSACRAPRRWPRSPPAPPDCPRAPRTARRGGSPARCSARRMRSIMPSARAAPFGGAMQALGDAHQRHPPAASRPAP